MLNELGNIFPNIDWESLAAVDIGNSRAKLFCGGTIESFGYGRSWSDLLLTKLEECKPKYIGISAVNKNRLGELKYSYGFSRYRSVFQDELLSRQDMLKYSKIEGIGSDRLFGMLGGLSFSKPPLITIDCGTAITVNAVDKNSECIGGAILAGMQTQLNALTFRAEALKKIHLGFTGEAVGTNTADALRTGIIGGAAGAIEHLAIRIIGEKFDGADTKVYITGGAAPIVLPAFGLTSTFKPEHKPGLVLTGILAALAKCL